MEEKVAAVLVGGVGQTRGVERDHIWENGRGEREGGEGGGSDEGMLVEKGGAFDLKFRPGGNRGGATHSNACTPPSPSSAVWAAVWISDSHTMA